MLTTPPLHATVAASAAAEASPSAPASAEPSERPTHSGWYGALSVGFGVGTGTYNAAIVNSTRWSGSFDGGVVDVGGAIGYGVLPGLAFALEAGIWRSRTSTTTTQG